jgi:DNA (cytosine-5)-methyltransferase 1
MFVYIDLFAGAGGLSLGLQRAGGRPVLAVELDQECVETYELNFPGSAAVAADVREFDWAGLKADVVVGGPPCQGFSSLGHRRADDPRNALTLEMLRCTETVSPRALVVENVPRFLQSSQCAHLTARLREAGFAVRTGVVNCADYGVPQRRSRALLVAALRGLPIPWPRPTHGAQGLPRHRTVADAFARLPSQPDGVNRHDAKEVSQTYLERFRSIGEGGARRQLPPDLELPCWREASGHNDVLGRLEWHKPATTVRTEFFRPEKGRFLHPVEDRPITAREAARLQSFPDSFRFPERHTLYSLGRQIGNAVPPLLGEAIGRALVDMLSYVDITEEASVVVS